jgi:DUF971 family protein
MANTLIPVKLDAKKSDRVLFIDWSDGHHSEIPFGLLRAGCPCVECRGGHENMHADPDPEIFSMKLPDTPATNLSDISLVGSYGLNIQWNDGHHHGIYHWTYLRKLCPCDACQDEKSK